MASVFFSIRFIVPPVKDQIRLAREEIIWYVGGIDCRVAFVHDVIVFAIFLAVRLPPRQGLPF